MEEVKIYANGPSIKKYGTKGHSPFVFAMHAPTCHCEADIASRSNLRDYGAEVRFFAFGSE